MRSVQVSFLYGTIKVYKVEAIKDPKIAVIVSKKHTPTAVGRNYIKRRVFQGFQGLLPLLIPCVYVVYPKKSVKIDENFQTNLQQVLKKHNFLDM